MKKLVYAEIEGKSKGFLKLAVGLLAMIGIGLSAAYYMEHNGHIVTGMNNQIVWGLPHVFAIFLIVAASGALNVASISSVFGKTAYKPLAPLSGLVSIALLLGGLSILLLDLGRPDRLIVAMTHYNFSSIFTWNILLYNGFFAIVIVYLWTLMEGQYNKYSRHAGMLAFIWRLILTTGTGSIFGFLVARETYDAAIMAPMFIVMSFSFGLAMFILILYASYHWTGRPLGISTMKRLKNLLGVFVAGVMFLVTIFHITNLYAAEHDSVEHFMLSGSGYAFIFWVFQIGLGSILPLVYFYHSRFKDQVKYMLRGAGLVILGGFSQLYVIIIGGQAYPLELFPGYEVSSTFYDGEVAEYFPSLPEMLLGIGGIAISLFVVLFAIKLLKFLPISLADEDVDPHYKAKSTD